MTWDEEKFVKYFKKVIEIYDKYNISIPGAFDPLTRLYIHSPSTGYLENNENMQDIRELLKTARGTSKLKKKIGSMCDFIVYDKTTHVAGRYEEIRVMISAPGILLDLEDPAIAARYRAVLMIRDKWGIEGIILRGIFNREIRTLFKDICQLNLIRLDDEMLDELISTSDIRLNQGIDGKVKGSINFDDPDRWESTLVAVLEWSLPTNITIERAIELAIEKRDLWNRIRDEVSHGLGVW